jgi:hypothetical protein
MKRPPERIFLIISLLIAAIILLLVAREYHLSDGAPIPTNSQEKATRPYTIIVLPDTQVYAQFFPEIFMAQTAWIAEQRDALNIVFVSQEGDIVNIYDDEQQWMVADTAFKQLDEVVPYGVSPGNHDFSAEGKALLFQKYFPLSRFKHSGAWGGTFSDQTADYNKNSYFLFNADKAKYITFNIEHCPTDAVIDWVDMVLRLYPDRKAILTTHSFTDFRGQRSNKTICKVFGGEGDNAGEEIWEKLILQSPHPNLYMILSGHDIANAKGAARRTDDVNGQKIHQILANYQQMDQGGNGYLRIMTFKPTEQVIQVETYSPSLNTYMTDAENQFTLPL